MVGIRLEHSRSAGDGKISRSGWGEGGHMIKNVREDICFILPSVLHHRPKTVTNQGWMKKYNNQMSIQHGFLLIADITGYTTYLNQSELEHAQDVLKSLLELLIEYTRPPLVISRLAGDAVISYGLKPEFLSGQTFVQTLEETYVAFRKAIEIMVLNTSCNCNACANINALDLKFFVHYGTFALQKLDAHNELVGSDVNLIHRLLKNDVKEKVGVRAYTLYTDAAIDQLGLGEKTSQMISHRESYEDFGEVRAWVQDMHPVWQARRAADRIHIPDKEALAVMEVDLPVPISVAWDLVTSTEYRSLILHTERQEIRNKLHGRLGKGSVYHCFHGNGLVTTQTIVEWLPLEQLSTEDTTPFPGTTVLNNIRITPTDGGTHLRIVASKTRGKWPNRTLANLMGRFQISRFLENGIRQFVRKVEEDVANGIIELPGYFDPHPAHSQHDHE